MGGIPATVSRYDPRRYNHAPLPRRTENEGDAGSLLIFAQSPCLGFITSRGQTARRTEDRAKRTCPAIRTCIRSKIASRSLSFSLRVRRDVRSGVEAVRLRRVGFDDNAEGFFCTNPRAGRFKTAWMQSRTSATLPRWLQHCVAGLR